MIKVNGRIIALNTFSDGAFMLSCPVPEDIADVTWLFESNDELAALIFIVKHLRNNGCNEINLVMPYIPNARQDRYFERNDVFTMKYFADTINWLNFKTVTVLDPHSDVSAALIDRVNIVTPKKYIAEAIRDIGSENLIAYFPDEGAMKRYSDKSPLPFVFGMKTRDKVTRKIVKLRIESDGVEVSGKDILMIDDILSSGGTLLYSAQNLKALGARNIYIFISHCENQVQKSALLKENLITRIYTTDSTLTFRDDKIRVFDTNLA